MSIDENALRDEICFWGRSMFERGLTFGSSGNLSARLDDGFLVTPTGSCLGTLEPQRLSKLAGDGSHLGGDRPTKEWPLHLAIYEQRPMAGGIVHLHSTHATALSCLADTDPADALLPITPYSTMQLGRVALVAYAAPGTKELADLVRAGAERHSALLMANHGPVISAGSFRSAVFAAEELEETAKLILLVRDRNPRRISAEELEKLTKSYRNKAT